MVQGLGLAKKYLEKINEITKLDDGSYDITFINDVKINYAPKGIKKAVMFYIDENSEELIVPEPTETDTNTSNIDSNTESDIVEKQGFQLTLPEKYNSLFSEENLEILAGIINERKVYVNNDNIILPEYYRTLKNDITISLKTNSEIYSQFKKYAAVNGLTVASLANYIMDMFLKNIKSNK
ncbi:hypothetical protein KST12_12320 (plasmid) [Fusobacterium polymorphum]|jgi:hypothetical protein|uniref:EAL domain-containing protein n=1 Tax=Fusobacterium nucleatum 13_3C TaxID=1357398 RepID=X7RUZ3_FUSNU|nr:hypothetical protein [Fusobacterium nucleatum]ETZ24938.1 hypothetical protein HMPREF2085_02499 [Fusobacterium nucleatum 13_3C]